MNNRSVDKATRYSNNKSNTETTSTTSVAYKAIWASMGDSFVYSTANGDLGSNVIKDIATKISSSNTSD
jgi:hypothetical protein